MTKLVSNSTLKQTCWLSRYKANSEDLQTNNPPSDRIWMHRMAKLKRLQNQAMRVILRANKTNCTHFMRNTLGLLTLYNRRPFLRSVFIFKILNNQNCPKQLEGYLTSRAELQNRNLRNQGTLNVPQSRTSSARKTFQIAGASDWNSLPTELRKTTSTGSFKFNLFKQLRNTDISNHSCTV